MIMSMTGFGNNTLHLENTTITVEIRTVNSRYFDFVPKMPRLLLDMEIDIKNALQSFFRRGRIEVYISTTGDSLHHKQLQVDYPLVDQYIHHLENIRSKYALAGEIPIEALATNSDIFKIEEVKSSTDELKEKILKAVTTAARQVLKNRQSEGAFLQEDIANRVKKLENMVKSIEAEQDKVTEVYRTRIYERVTEHLSGKIAVDEGKLMQEIALLVEKGDIAEELTRLYSHLHHFMQLLQKEETVGRKLDFITQELHREVNTIGSKALDTAISEYVVEMKSEVERIKEQVQNIE